MKKLTFTLLLLFFCPSVNAESFPRLDAITEKAITECFYDSGEFTILEIETAINKSRSKSHSFGDYDKFIMNQIMTKENQGNNNSQDNWLKTSEGRKAVSIAKLYFDDECLIDEANVKNMLTVLRPFVDKPQKINSSASSYDNSSNNDTNIDSCDVDCWLGIGEKVVRYINIFNSITSFLTIFN